MNLGTLVYKTVHEGKHKVDRLADLMGCSSSLLYRAANPHDSGAHLSIAKAIPLMLAQGDFRILHHLAARTGHLVYKVPRVKAASPKNASDLQMLFAEAIQGLLRLGDGDVSEDYALEKMDALLRKILGVRKSIEKGKQLDLGL